MQEFILIIQPSVVIVVANNPQLLGGVMNRVCSERKLKGWTQQDLAEHLGVDKSTIVRWEGGGNIPQEKIIGMRSLFKCDIDWLLGVADERKTV